MLADLNKGDVIYYARIIPKLGIYDVCDIVLRTVTDEYFAGMDKRDKRAYLFSYKNIGNNIFLSRKEALDKVHLAEKNKPTINNETYYEEY